MAVNGGWKKSLARLSLELEAVEIPQNVRTLFLSRSFEPISASLLSGRCEQQQQPAVELEVGGGGGSHSLQTSVLSLLADKQGGGGGGDRRVSCVFGGEGSGRAGGRASDGVSEWDKCWREKKSARQQL